MPLNCRTLAMDAHAVLPLLLAGVAMAQPPGTFTPTASLLTPRFAHTATLLANGKVLIAGGNTVCFYAPPACLAAYNAELYDPATGSFTATGPMSTVQPAGGVLLPDGRVLFAGGDGTGTVARVELYDPSTGTFAVAGNLATLTAVSSATLLNDGRVLLGGMAGPYSAPLYGAELYDPAVGTFVPVAGWTAQNPMAATRLVDGRIFFQYYEANAQIYDPAAGTFSSTGSLQWFDDPPPATLLLNGKVLFTGGDGGGATGVELYNPPSGTFANGTMSVPRDGHTATLLPDGTVLLAGGAPTQSHLYPSTATASLYDPATGMFAATAAMRAGRAAHTATLLNNGQVLITGGTLFDSLNSISGLSSAELYTPAVLIPAPVLFTLPGGGQGQAAIWHATTGETVSPASPAVAGDALAMYTTSLPSSGVIPPQVTVGGRLAQVLYFGDAPGYPGYNQVNFRLPDGLAPAAAVPVRLTYLGRISNPVTLAVQ